MRAHKFILAKLQNSAFAPVDIASLVFFRIAFGLLMIWHVSWYFSDHRIARFWLEPRFLFKYYGFAWVHPWPGNGLYIHWAVVGLLALFIAAGFLYRASAALFCLGYTYAFLLDEALWVNHRYLICLFSFLLVFVPANRALSIDAWLNPKIRSETTPAWALWLLRTQMAVVYFYAGIAKIMPDWLHGEPMRVWLARDTQFPIIGRFFREEWTVYSLSYAALFFDLFIVAFLFWRRTRVAAFCAAVAFHLLNYRLFYIGVFPWLAIAGTTLFLSPTWPRRVVAIFGVKRAQGSVAEMQPPPPGRQRLVLTLVLLYIAIQIVVPLRPFLSGGGIEWIQAEHRFTWRMMLTSKWQQINFYVTDPNSRSRRSADQVRPEDYLTPWQVDRMQWRPDMLLQFAHYIARIMPQAGPKPLRVEARVLIALNGRKPRLFIDQNVDLAAEERSWGRPRWLLRIHEPLPDHRRDPLQDPFEPALEDLN
jgi:vitamin K-dependent gamma-carboxylase